MLELSDFLSHKADGEMRLNPFDPGYYSSQELRGLGFNRVGENVIIARNCTIIGLQNISIGDNVRIDGGVTLACNSGYLNIGSYVHIGTGCYLGCSGGIALGNFAGLSQGVRLYSATDDYSGEGLTNPTVPKEFLKVRTEPVVLGNHVIIGSGSIVLPGVCIGVGSSVGALSLVGKSISQWGVYAGCPLRKLKDRKMTLLDVEKQLIYKRGSQLPDLNN